jgi:hypothetical protein
MGQPVLLGYVRAGRAKLRGCLARRPEEQAASGARCEGELHRPPIALIHRVQIVRSQFEAKLGGHRPES